MVDLLLRRFVIVSWLLGSLVIHREARADGIDVEAPPPKKASVEFTAEELRPLTEEAVKKAVKEEGVAEDNTRKFAGFSFGVGIAATLIHRARDSRIDEAELAGDDQRVRVKKKTRVPTRLLLESHYFFTPGKTKCFGIGPFLAVQAGSQEVVEAVGFGLMGGLRRGTTSNSFNIGVGGLIDAASPVLGGGVKENEPLPAGETTIRIKQRTVYSWLFMFSFSF